MPASLGVVCLSLACVNQSFAFVFLDFLLDTNSYDESETEVLSLACLVSQHAIRRHRTGRKRLPAFCGWYYLSCPCAGCPGTWMKGMNHSRQPGEFPVFFLAKEDPDIDVSPDFYQENRLVSENVHLYVPVRSNSVSPL